MMRTMLEEYLLAHPGIQLTGSAQSTEDAVGLAESITPDVILLGLQDRVGDQVERLRTAMPQARIIWMSWLEGNGARKVAQTVGVDGYVDKDKLTENLVQKIMEVAQQPNV